MMSGSAIMKAASLAGVVQSAVWGGFALASTLVFLCVIPVAPYESPADFFRVTYVKLYFEGPKCIPDGKYLGKFNEDYKNPEKIDLLKPEIIFGMMVGYFILNMVHLVLSALLYLNRRPKTSQDVKHVRNIAMLWSAVILIISAVDAFFTAELIMDEIKLKVYMNDNAIQEINQLESRARPNIIDTTYIPLTLAFLSSRFMLLWLWNTLLGGILLVNAVCRRQFFEAPAPKLLSPQQEHLEPKETKTLNEQQQPVNPPGQQLLSFAEKSNDSAKEITPREICAEEIDYKPPESCLVEISAVPKESDACAEIKHRPSAASLSSVSSRTSKVSC